MRVHYVLEHADGGALLLTIGVFDGVHAGHRAIVEALVERRRSTERVAVLTFSNHPASFLRPGTEPAFIATLEERMTLLAGLGVDDAYVIRFDAKIAGLAAEQFLTDVLVGALRVKALAIGENFRFGAGRTGDATVARSVLSGSGCEVITVPPLTIDGERVSSTRIRAALTAGRMEEADQLLGAPYTLRGTVVLGEGRGHALGFPTANVSWPGGKLIPMDGVYTIVGRHDGVDYPGLASIGTKPTFANGTRAVEAWLRDLPTTIYGQEVSLRNFRFIRSQRAFSSAEELRAQMRQDATHVQFSSFVPA